MILRNERNCLVAGRLTRDASNSRVGAKKTPLTKMSVAYAENGFMDIAVWSDMAHATANYKKGDHVFVAGVLSDREYNGKTYWTLTADFIAKSAELTVENLETVKPLTDDGFKDIQSEDIPF